MKKVAYTVGDLITILSKVDENLPLPNGFVVALGYQTPIGFEELDDDLKKPENSFLAVDIYPSDIYSLNN